MNIVWVTRPISQARQLAAALKKHHLQPWIKPAMRIVGMDGEHSLRQLTAHANRFDIAIFVSAEAVARCHSQLPPHSLPPVMLPIGANTRVAMVQAGYSPPPLSDDIIGDSNALLALSSLQPAQVRGKNIAILGGMTGDNANSVSPTLAQALRQREAQVTAIAVYRRLLPTPFSSDENKWLQQMAAAKQLSATVAYSSDTARHMLTMATPAADWLRQLALFVIHPHIALTAKQLGYVQPILAPADSESMAATISRFICEKPPNSVNGL